MHTLNILASSSLRADKPGSIIDQMPSGICSLKQDRRCSWVDPMCLVHLEGVRHKIYPWGLHHESFRFLPGISLGCTRDGHPLAHKWKQE